MEEHFYGEKDNDSELSSDDGKDEGNYTFCFVFFFWAIGLWSEICFNLNSTFVFTCR